MRAPGFACGFCGRGIAGCVPPAASVPELCCATLCAAACAAWVGAVVPPGVVTIAPSRGGGIGPPLGGVGPTAPKCAGIFCPATQDSNCCGVTVKTRKRMLAWDEPQYSTQKPFQTEPPTEVSGVYQI